MSCCTEFKIRGFTLQGDGTWAFYTKGRCRLTQIKFCPFCGKALNKYEIGVANIIYYHVWLDGKSVAHFKTRKEAEDYVLLQRVQ